MHERDESAVSSIRGARLGATGWYRARCPFCEERVGSEDKRGAFGLRAATGDYHCFRCGVVGRLRSVPDDLWSGEPEETEHEGAVTIDPPESYMPIAHEPAVSALVFSDAKRYLRDRGVSRSTCAEARVGVCGAGFFAGRIIVPVVQPSTNGDARWLGFVARDWTNRAEMRYRYPKGMRRGLTLFNHDAILCETDEPVLVVEGVFDALPYWPHAVACLGKPSYAQVEALRTTRRPLAICLDGDAHREGYWLAQRLRFDGIAAGSVRLPPCSDPNSVDHHWLRTEAQRCTRRRG